MAMVVKNNVAAQMVLGELNKAANNLEKDLKKISTGTRINGAGDDSTTFAISEKMREQIRSLEQDSQNVQNGSSLLKVAEDGINNIVDELRNLKELAINSANDHNTDRDRATIQKEFEQKMANINDIANTTNYNGIYLLDGRWKPLAGDGAMVTLTGIETITTYDYKTEDYIETVTTYQNTIETYTETNVTNTVVSEPYSETLTVPTIISETYTDTVTVDTVVSEPYSETLTVPTIISEPYTDTVKVDTVVYELYSETLTVPTIISNPYTDTVTVDTVVYEPYSETLTVPTIISETYTYTDITYKTVEETHTETATTVIAQPIQSTAEPPKTATPTGVTEPFGNYVIPIGGCDETTSPGKYLIDIWEDNTAYWISNEFAMNGGVSGGKPLIITIPEGITNVKFMSTVSNPTYLNVYFDVKSPNANIWFQNLKLSYNSTQVRSVIKFTGDNNVLTFKGTNIIDTVANANYGRALIDVGDGLTIERHFGGGSLEVNVKTIRNGAVIGSDGSEHSNANITLNNADITVNGTYAGENMAGALIGAGAYGSIGDIAINGGTLNFSVVGNGACIGGGLNSAVGNITIQDATITADNKNGSCIGSGYADSGKSSSVGSIYIQDSTLNLTTIGTGAGIGTGGAEGGSSNSVGDITIDHSKGTITTQGIGADKIGTGGGDGDQNRGVVYITDPPAGGFKQGENGLPTVETETVEVETTVTLTNTVTIPVEETLTGTHTINSTVETVVTGVKEITVLVESLVTGMHTINSTVETVVTGTKEVTVPVESVVTGTHTINSTVETVMTGTKEVTIPVESVVTGTHTINSTVETVMTGTKEVTIPVEETLTKTRPVTITVYDTQPATRTIAVPNYVTQTFEYEMLADLLKNPLKIHHGTKANQHIQLYIDDMRTKALGTSDLLDDDGHFLKAEDEDLYWALSYDRKKREAYLETLKAAQNKSLDDIDVKTKDNANIAIRVLDGALDTALLESVRMGAYLQRLEYTGANIITMNENIQAAESTIRDADMAKEMVSYTKDNILSQIAQTMLAQANQSASSVLNLLQ